MKKNIALVSCLSLVIALALMAGCSNSPDPNVTIQINLGQLSGTANTHYRKSLIDRILCLFSSEARAQFAPEGITSIDVSVTGEGMSPFSASYPADTLLITLAVEAGPSRVFQVTANRALGNYGGSATRDIREGAIEVIPISMEAQYASVTINPSFPMGALAASTVTYSVSATVDGTSILSDTFTPGAAIQMGAGAGRAFTVTAETPSVTFTGTAEGDLAADAAVTVEPAMALSATQLVIPDHNNHRIVQIDEDFNNPNWINTASTLSGYYLSPYDIDYDRNGRFYVANNDSTYGGVLRLDDINDSDVDRPITTENVVSLAIDRVNDQIYYATSSQLYRANLDGTNIKNDFDMAGVTNIRGIAVTNSGIILIAQNVYFTAYNPNANGGNGAVINSIDYSDPMDSECWDITAKQTGIFGTLRNYVYQDSNSIIGFILDNNNNLVRRGEPYIPATYLYGPKRIIETVSDRIYYIDENDSANRFSVIDDISGAGRLDFYDGVNSSNEGCFSFFQ